MSDAAEMAEDVIHPTMYHGHSSVCESRFKVVTKYRSKNKALEKSAYEFFTNMGLIYENMKWAYDGYGPDYHWMIDMLERMKLSVNMPLVKAITSRTKRSLLARVARKSEASKKYRITRKQARNTEQEEWKRWTRNRKVAMSYGEAD